MRTISICATAHLSTPLGALFATPVVVACCRGPGAPAVLSAGERADVARAAPARLGEFAAGRLCARRALAEFGLADAELRVAVDRQPRWPAGFTGSITHTEGCFAAAVAPVGRVLGVGLDVETVGRVGARLLPRVATEAEMAWIESLGAAARPGAASLLFSAKEAFYKAQFALTGERLGFHDVAIAVRGWQGSGGEFDVRALRPLALETRALAPLSGRFAFDGALVFAAIVCAAP